MATNGMTNEHEHLSILSVQRFCDAARNWTDVGVDRDLIERFAAAVRGCEDCAHRAARELAFLDRPDPSAQAWDCLALCTILELVEGRLGLDTDEAHHVKGCAACILAYYEAAVAIEMARKSPGSSEVKRRASKVTSDETQYGRSDAAPFRAERGEA
jgi:hypothetical protein